MASELGTGSASLSHFSADFWEDKVYIQNQEFQAGFFMIPLLNDKQSMLELFRASGMLLHPIISNLQNGFLNIDEMEEIRELLHVMCLQLKKIEPFCYMNASGSEDAYIDFIMSETQIQTIQDYLSLMGKQAQEKEKCQITVQDLRRIHDGRFFYHRLMDLLSFYSLLYQDGKMISIAVNSWLKTIANAKKLDERRIIESFCHLYPQGYSDYGIEFDGGDRMICRLAKVEIEYVAMTLPQKRGTKIVTARRMHFTRWIDFIITDLFEGIHHGHYPKRCEVCGNYFLTTNGHVRKYCDGIDPNSTTGLTCRQSAAKQNRQKRENPKAHPIKKECTKRLKTLKQYEIRGILTQEQQVIGKKRAQDCRDHALMDSGYARKQYLTDISQTEIMKWIESKQ